MDDADALAGQTFYRAVASPAVAGRDGYIEVLNPTGSGVNTFIDDFYVYSGSPTITDEIGIIHYATPFDQTGGAFDSPGMPAYSVFLVPTFYSRPTSKTVLWVGTYPGQLEPQVDYFFQAPMNTQEPRLQKPSYPIILAPGDGIVFWSPNMGQEMKVGLWIRERPVA